GDERDGDGIEDHQENDQHLRHGALPRQEEFPASQAQHLGDPDASGRRDRRSAGASLWGGGTHATPPCGALAVLGVGALSVGEGAPSPVSARKYCSRLPSRRRNSAAKMPCSASSALIAAACSSGASTKSTWPPGGTHAPASGAIDLTPRSHGVVAMAA